MGGTSCELVFYTRRGGRKGMAVEYNGAKGESRKVVESEDGFDIVLLKDAGIKYFLSPGSGFFFGLEYEDDIVAGLAFGLAEQACGLQQDCSMAVVSTAVTGRQGIDVAAQGYGGH